MELNDEQEVLDHLRRWAAENELVRAAVLTSSRAAAESRVDALSDYDIELYVSDLGSFQKSDDWLDAWGPVLMRWPLTPRSTYDERWLTRLVLFKSGLRIDFQITASAAVAPDAYQQGCRVLIDKDGLTASLAEPSFNQYFVKRPTREEFERLVTEFWWEASYVAKYLWRAELPFAKYMFDAQLRHGYLHKVIEWHIGQRHSWQVNVGLHGRWFQRLLEADTWAAYESTFAGAEIDQNWAAFFRMLELFRGLAQPLAGVLGYDYPQRLALEALSYFKDIRALGP